MNESIQNQIQAQIQQQLFKIDEWSVIPTIFSPNSAEDFYELTLSVSLGLSSDDISITFGFRGYNGEGEEPSDYDFEVTMGNGDWASPLEMHQALGAALQWLRAQEWYRGLSVCGETHK